MSCSSSVQIVRNGSTSPTTTASLNTTASASAGATSSVFAQHPPLAAPSASFALILPVSACPSTAYGQQLQAALLHKVIQMTTSIRPEHLSEEFQRSEAAIAALKADVAAKEREIALLEAELSHVSASHKSATETLDDLRKTNISQDAEVQHFVKFPRHKCYVRPSSPAQGASYSISD